MMMYLTNRMPRHAGLTAFLSIAILATGGMSSFIRGQEPNKEQPKPVENEKTPVLKGKITKVVRQYAEALISEDVDTLMKTAALPHFVLGGEIHKDQDKLRERFQELFEGDGPAPPKRKLLVTLKDTLAECEKSVGVELSPARRRQLANWPTQPIRFLTLGLEGDSRRKESAEAIIAVVIQNGSPKVVGIVPMSSADAITISGDQSYHAMDVLEPVRNEDRTITYKFLFKYLFIDKGSPESPILQENPAKQPPEEPRPTPVKPTTVEKVEPEPLLVEVSLILRSGESRATIPLRVTFDAKTQSYASSFTLMDELVPKADLSVEICLPDRSSASKFKASLDWVPIRLPK